MSQFFRVNKYKVNIVLLVCLTLLFMSAIVFQGRRPQTQIVTLAASTADFKIRPSDVQQIKQNDLNVKGFVSGNYQKFRPYAGMINANAIYDTDCLINNCALDYKLFLARLDVQHFLEIGWGCRF